MVNRAKLFRECRDALGWPQASLARQLWVAHRTVVHWEAGDREVPGPVWVALSYMLRDDREHGLLERVRSLRPQKMGETVGEILK